MQWRKASERLPKEGKDVGARKNGYYGELKNIDGILVLFRNYLGTLEIKHLEDVEWLDESQSESTPSISDGWAELVKDFAAWSRKYPRETIYGASLQPQMDGELIKLEERAKELSAAPAPPLTDINKKVK